MRIIVFDKNVITDKLSLNQTLRLYHCSQCGGRHSDAYMGCPKYKDAQKVQEIKNKDKLSYAEACRNS